MAIGKYKRIINGYFLWKGVVIMNRYIVAINRADDEDAWLFLVFADDTREYVNKVIIEAQKEFHFSDCCELMDYVCDTYDFKWEDFSYDISFDMNV